MMFKKKTNLSQLFEGVGNTQSAKLKLIKECQKYGVCTHIDDPSEEMVDTPMKAVASEAELQVRLNQAKALKKSSMSNIIAFLALLVSIVALIVAIQSRH